MSMIALTVADVRRAQGEPGRVLLARDRAGDHAEPRSPNVAGDSPSEPLPLP